MLPLQETSSSNKIQEVATVSSYTNDGVQLP